MCRVEVECGQHDKELDCQRGHSEDYLISTVRVVAEEYCNENEQDALQNSTKEFAIARLMVNETLNAIQENLLSKYEL